MHTWEFYDYDEYFLKFMVTHPQLQYCKDKIDLRNLQNMLCKKYNNKEYTKDEVTNVYNNYVLKNREHEIIYYKEEFKSKEQLKEFKQKNKDIVDKFIKELILENI